MVVVRYKAVVDPEPGFEDAMEEQVLEMLAEDERFKPIGVIADAPYAMAVEFGTGPATKRAAVNLHAELDQWAFLKLHMHDPSERARFVSNVHKNIVRHGIPPRSFMRKAMERLQPMIYSGFFRDGGSTEELARILVSDMRRILAENKSNYTGALSSSIRIVYDVEEMEKGDEPDINPDAWNDSEMDYKGVKRPPAQRRRRR